METFSALLALCEGNPIVTRWIPLIKATDAELWCFLWSAPEPTVEQTFKTPVIWDPLRSLWRHCNESFHSLVPMYEILYAVVCTLCWRHSSKCKRVQVNKTFSESLKLSAALIYIYIYIHTYTHMYMSVNETIRRQAITWKSIDLLYTAPTLSMIDGFPLQRTSNVELGCFFGVNVNRMFNKESKCRWSETSWISAVKGTNFSEIRVKMLNFWLEMHSKMSPAKWRSFCLSLNVL